MSICFEDYGNITMLKLNNPLSVAPFLVHAAPSPSHTAPWQNHKPHLLFKPLSWMEDTMRTAACVNAYRLILLFCPLPPLFPPLPRLLILFPPPSPSKSKANKRWIFLQQNPQ